MVTANPAFAQQTIFNVPSADVTPQGSVFLQTESQFRPWAPGRFWLGTQYFAVGITPQTELDVTLFNQGAPRTTNLSIGVGLKHVVPMARGRHASRQLAWTVGQMVPISLQGRGVGSWSYTHLSGRLPRLNTRLTAGINVGTRQIFGRNQVSALAGVEHPLTQRVTLLADWFSGTHDSALLIAGFSVALPAETGLYVGYQVPNTSRSGRQGLVVELSKRF